MAEMIELIGIYGLALLAVLVVALLIAWWIWSHRSTERVRADTPDVLTPGAAPAERNTLLVEAPPATAAVRAPPPASVATVSAGEALAAPLTEQTPPTEQTAAPAGLAEDRPAIPPAHGEPDDLTRIKGVGPKLKARLTELGITRYDQIAAWSAADAARVDSHLGVFQGRIVRDNWIEQCRYLAAGDTAGFEERFGKV